MGKLRRLTIFVLLALLLIVSTNVTLAATPFNTTTVETGERISNDIILFDGDLFVESDAVVDGDVVLFNGSLTLSGRVNGDVVVFNGNMVAAETAVIAGDCLLLNGTIEDSTPRSLGCTQVGNLSALIPNLPPALLQMPMLGETAMGDWPQHNRSGWSILGNLARIMGNSLLMGFLAFVTMALLPEQVGRTTQTIRQRVGASGLMGLLTAVAVPSVIALLLPVSVILTFVCIGLLGFPIMFVLAVGLGAGLLLGWIGLGHLLAERIANMFNLQLGGRTLMTALSTAFLTFMLGVLALLPGGFIITFGGWVLAMVGLGAVALTQFGTRDYPSIRTPQPNPDKITAVLETLPVEETERLKSNP